MFKCLFVNHCCLLENKELRNSQYRSCTVAYKENNVYNIYMKPRRNKIDAMPLSEDSDNRSMGGLPAGSDTVRPENPDPEDPGGAHDPMRDVVDGEERRWCRWCQTFLLSPVQERSPNTS